ncbi:hypothetical protein BSUW23_09885 [Bacillus spizizenii str. W23]|uniref:Uncharacterized protein n=1 Tax=Bacillus spizizenii (strain ATCC 23059 / NRRL B-14472 / W23) TaxID=655816 RepID=E0TY21_BACSH|nr:hypothetical protein BSUW23_09885 [Bacillus spizizenii str. W23]AJW87344.1 hypothetical protein BIS30_20440 [Bacillus spizizenii]EFG93163.1 hypothetical protein BSU6633_05909 [Bacillus spizizenii ATCC 6633 = JCM 2499]
MLRLKQLRDLFLLRILLQSDLQKRSGMLLLRMSDYPVWLTQKWNGLANISVAPLQIAVFYRKKAE